MVLESTEGTVPHDPSLDPLIVEWAEKLNISLPKGFENPMDARAATQQNP